MDLAVDSFLHVVDYLPIVVLYQLGTTNIGCWKYLCYRMADNAVVVELLEQLQSSNDHQRILDWAGHCRILNCLLQYTVSLRTLDAIGIWIDNNQSRYNSEIAKIIEEQRKEEFHQRISTKIWATLLLLVIGFANCLWWMTKFVFVAILSGIVAVVTGFTFAIFVGILWFLL